MGRKNNKEDVKRFELLFVPHLNAAHNLACWLVRDRVGAQDILQDSCLRAFASLHQFTGGNARAWLLTIVRNQSYSWLKKSTGKNYLDIDDQTADISNEFIVSSDTPESLLEKVQNSQLLQRALDLLPILYREVIVLKELEAMSYKEIALVTGVPIGTVMSRLARGRELLKRELSGHE